MSTIPPEFVVKIDPEKCTLCRRCVIECSFGALKLDEDRIVSENEKCVACHRCVVFCPTRAISVIKNPLVFRPHATWTENIRRITRSAWTRARRRYVEV